MSLDNRNMKVCKRCETKVEKETELDYPYYCPNCDENLYEFETKIKVIE